MVRLTDAIGRLVGGSHAGRQRFVLQLPVSEHAPMHDGLCAAGHFLQLFLHTVSRLLGNLLLLPGLKRALDVDR